MPDDIYPADGVQNEAEAWTSWGYETHFERVEGAGHYIDEATYGIRATAWAWIEEFTRRN